MAFSKVVDETLTPGTVREQSKIDGDLAMVQRVQSGDVAAFDQLIYYISQH